MFPVKKTKPVKASTDTSAVAAKIKHKILNSSSFIKASLQTNNRALARALQVQKERRGQLEKEVAYLQSQVEALCFELATRKYKERKLLHLLKGLHSDTLERLSEAAGLLSDLECPGHAAVSGHDTAATAQDDAATATRGHDTVASGHAVVNRGHDAITQDAAATAEDAAATTRGHDAAASGHAATAQDDATARGHAAQSVCNDEGKESDVCSQSAPPPTSRPSVGPREGEGEGPDVNAASVLKPQEPPSQRRPAEPRPPPGGWQEKTLLLNTTMEMTVCNATEIVAVETRKAKGKTEKKCKTRNASSPTVRLPPADTRTPAVPECPPPDTQLNRPAPSRIPKLGLRQDQDQDQDQPPDPPRGSDPPPPHLDDCFSSVNRSAFVSCRSRVKKASSVARETVVTPPAESCQATPPAQPPPEEDRRPEPGPAAPRVETGFRRINCSRGGNRSRCRSTFFVVGDGALPDRVSQSPDPTPLAGSGPDPPGPPTGGTEPLKSWKRPWTAAQEPRGGGGLDSPTPTDHLDVQTHKRARREDAAAAGAGKLRSTFVVYRETTTDGGRSSRVGGVRSPDAAVQGGTGDLLMDELPPWLVGDVGDTEASGVLDSSAASVEAVQPPPGTAPTGRVLTSLTNSVTSPGGEASGRTKRRHHQVSYKEPPLNRKMRREEPGLKENNNKKTKKKKKMEAVKDESSGRVVKD